MNNQNQSVRHFVAVLVLNNWEFMGDLHIPVKFIVDGSEGYLVSSLGFKNLIPGNMYLVEVLRFEEVNGKRRAHLASLKFTDISETAPVKEVVV